MKKIRLCILMILMLSVAGCGTKKVTVTATSQSTESDTEETSDIQLERLDILSGERNPNGIWDICWPNYYYQENEIIQFPESVSVSEEDRDILLKFYNENENNYIKDKEFLCSIRFGVLDGNCSLGKMIYIYDEYPEDFDKVVDAINRICGGDKEYLSMTGNIQEITPEYFTLLTGIDDDKVKGGTVQEVIDHLNIQNISDIQRFKKNWVIDDVVANYSLCRYLPYEIKQAPSTDAECKEYAEKLAKSMGATGKVTKVYSEHISGHEWYKIYYKNQFIRVYRSELVVDDIHAYDGLIDSTYNSLSLEEDTSDETNPLSSHLLFDFVYSNDSKFIVAVDFCENLERTKDYFYEVAQAVEMFEKGADASATDAASASDASEGE